MLRSISIIVLGVATVAATPLDAQLMRRFSPGVQQRFAYPSSNCNQSYQPQAYQARAEQSAANCTGNQYQQPQQNQVASQLALQGAAPTPATNQDIQTQQRYAIYYNPRTNQTYLRPIQSVARTVQDSKLNPFNLRANRQSAQAATAPYAAPPVARTPEVQLAPVALNAPAPTPVAVPLSPAVAVPELEPAMNAPVGTLTSQPSPTISPTPTVEAPVAALKTTEETSNKTFSVLESSDTPTLAPAKVDGDPGELLVKEPGEVLDIDLNQPNDGDK